ncbi:MAG TPA: hypothetical protein VHZ97_09185 [Pseudonocardiaceae bacterium]|nr:hypothetical protein [Pseudonocardiaceae bacterium]
MPDVATLSNLATALGTLVLAVATFASIRSSNRSARVAERALLQNLKPVMSPSLSTEPMQKLMWQDRHWAHLNGGRAVAEVVDDRIYLAVSLRNVGAGIGVLQGWYLNVPLPTVTPTGHRPVEEFRPQGRDIYIAPGDTSFWQAAVRDKEDEFYQPVRDSIEAREPFGVELLYSDHEGGQLSISWVSVLPISHPDADTGEPVEEWLPTISRHWTLNGSDPRH